MPSGSASLYSRQWAAPAADREESLGAHHLTSKHRYPLGGIGITSPLDTPAGASGMSEPVKGKTALPAWKPSESTIHEVKQPVHNLALLSGVCSIKILHTV